MDYRAMVIIAILNNVCHLIDAKLNVTPRDTEVKINDSTYINCSTSLQAEKVQWRHGNYYVYTGIAIIEPYNDGRFSVEINASTGASNLVIRSVRPTDAGKYECTEDEGFGEKGTAELIVLEADPVCKSNLNPDGVIGPNSCDVREEEVKFSCSITYHGNVLPILQWKANGDNESVNEGLFNVTSSNNEVTYSLTMKSELGLNNSSFICQTTRTSKTPYTCSSNNINILYIFSRKVTINMTMNDEVSCFANSSQSCSYKWKWFNGVEVSTESDSQILNPKKSGWHRCEATCFLGNNSCVVESLHANVYSDAATNSRNWMPLLALLLVPVLGVGLIIAIIYLRRKQMLQKLREMGEHHKLQVQKRKEEEERLRSHGLIATIRTNAAIGKNKAIFGLTILDKELFIVNKECSEVEAYDLTKLSLSRRLKLETLVCPRDIVSCDRNKCLYIFDDKDGRQSNGILRVEPNGNVIKNNYWSTRDAWGQLSVTCESTVILAAYSQNKLIEYSPVGLLMREIKLSSGEQSFLHPVHAIQLANCHFVVCHGEYDDELHRVCIVDADGKHLKSYGDNPGSTIEQANTPNHLSVDKNGFVIVADSKNSRVLLLDSDLKFEKEILTEQHGIRHPWKILLDESNDRLFVADNDLSNQRILIYSYNDKGIIWT